MKQEIFVQNIKCGGCANSISKQLSKVESITNIQINVEKGSVSWDTIDDGSLSIIKSKLAKMGYPEGDPTLMQTAKSFVSCAVGRLDL